MLGGIVGFGEGERPDTLSEYPFASAVMSWWELEGMFG